VSVARVPARGLLVSPFRGAVADAVDGLLALHFRDAVTVLDMSYGRGRFWHPTMPRGLKLTTLDIDPAGRPDALADFRALPFADRSFDVATFDPPYMTDTSERSIMGGRFGHFATIADLELAVRLGCREAARVSRLGMIVEVMNQTHGSRLMRMTPWVEAELGEPYDELIYEPPAKAEDPKWKRQLSVRKRHCYVLVYRHDGPVYRARSRKDTTR
jgi:hypothetical protein